MLRNFNGRLANDPTAPCFNLFLLPYQRATQYSGDLIGMAVCGDLQSSIEACGKLMVGRELSRRIRLKGMMNQAHEVHRSFFALLAKLLSSHPHMTDRYLNLLAFARYKYPREFERYADTFDNLTVDEIAPLLPAYFLASSPLPRPLEPPIAERGKFSIPGPGRPAAALIGAEGPLQGRCFLVEKKTMKLGADPSNDIVIDDEFASGSHAWLCYTGGDIILIDQRSTNDTWLNGMAVDPEGSKVKQGDVIRIGLSTLEVTKA